MKENEHTQLALDHIAADRSLIYYFFTCLLFVLLNLAFSSTVIAQVKPGDFFIVNSKAKVYPVTDFGISLAGNKDAFLFAKADQKFTVIDISDTGIIQIQFWKFKDIESNNDVMCNLKTEKQ